jgi:hypothetical protein
MAVIAFAMTIASLELIFSWAGLGEQEFMRIDPVTGCSGFPNKKVTWRKEGFSVVTLNNQGLNDTDRPFAKPPGTTRIVVLGDSQVEAMQVDRNSNFCSLLENTLSKPDHPIEVINCGSSSFNLGQMYLRLQNLGFRYQPDVVVLGVRPDAALLLHPVTTGGMFYSGPTFKLTSPNNFSVDYEIHRNWLASSEGQRMQSTSWLREHSRIWGVIGSQIERLLGQYKQQTQPAHAFAVRDPFENVKAADMWPLADAIISKMNDTCKAHNCQLVILELRSATQGDVSSYSKLLEATVSAHKIPYVSTVPGFDQTMKAANTKLYYAAHFTPAGHKIIAETLGPYFRDDSRLSDQRERQH